MLYLDTSALAKLYIIEPGGEAVEALAEENEGGLSTSVATFAEVLSVLARSLREKRISRRNYQVQKQAFLTDWSAFHVVDVTPAVLSPAPRLIERYGLRGFDAIQLCSALWIGRPLFACFDLRLRQAAAAQGLSVMP
ncbi:MAG: type II toxin-antitoxin system VapC family toxin [Acidobacteria bacterium]|nr:type II toxin-antitoxin system VapC family toxin [Acidobacteriota bacterium]